MDERCSEHDHHNDDHNCYREADDLADLESEVSRRGHVPIFSEAFRLRVLLSDLLQSRMYFAVAMCHA